MIGDLTPQQEKAVRLIELAQRRPATDREMERVRTQGNNFALFRLSFMLALLSEQDREALIAGYKDSIGAGSLGSQPAGKFAHDLELTRLRVQELQRRVDELSERILDLLGENAKIHRALRDYGELQRDVGELRQQIDNMLVGAF